MNEHFDSDTLATIGAAVRWDTAGGLRHLSECDDCRAQLEQMRLVRVSFLEQEEINPAALERVVWAVGAQARTERERTMRRAGWMGVVEPFVAGIAGLVVLASSGMRPASVGAAVLVILLGAALMAAGQHLARAVPAVYGDQ